jgi:hypothetical protein
MGTSSPRDRLDRRAFMTYFGGIGLGSTLLPGVLWARLNGGAELTVVTIAAAEEVAGLNFSDEQRELMLADLRDQRDQIERIHRVPLSNSVSPAIHFDPVVAGVRLPEGSGRGRVVPRDLPAPRPSGDEEIAFLPIPALAALIRSRQISSEELTRLYLARIAKYDPHLHAVVTVTEERALAGRRARRTARSRAAGTGAHSTGSRGVRRTCWPCAATPPPGARRRTGSR